MQLLNSKILSDGKNTRYSNKKAQDMGVPIRDYKKTKIILMGTPASEYRKESSNFFELSLCVEFNFAKENLFKLCIDYEKSI